MLIKKIILIVYLIIILILDVYAQQHSWTSLNSGTSIGVNGNVYAITTFNGNIVVAGGFSQAGGTNARNIAMWNGTTWQSLGSGVGDPDDTVRALTVFNGQLIAGGNFNQAGGNSANNIARWNGTSWQSLESGTDGEVKTLFVFNSELIAGGEFEHAGGEDANNIARWNGSVWSNLGSGMTGSGSRVSTLIQFGSDLVAAGRFSQAGGNNGNNIAKWNGTNWSPLSNGLGTGSDRVFALTVWNGFLVAGGRFSTAGGNSVANIARWNGTSWSNIGSASDLEDNDVISLISYNGDLIVGGNFKFAGTIYVDRITRWNGSWNRMVTGMNQKINTLWIKDTSLYAGGEFTTAGGSLTNHVTRWYNQITRSISGTIRYIDNNQLVDTGKVKAIRLDINTREAIVVDSSYISNGTYVLPRVTIDTLRVIIFPDDELDFPPTYYPSTVDWNNSIVVYPTSNLTNININVDRISPSPMSSVNATIGGYVYLNLIPPGDVTGTNYPYWRDAICYFKQGNLFRKFAVSRDDQTYNTTTLPSGTYQIFVSRLGYTTATRTVTLSTTNLDTINFYLNPSAPIGIINTNNNIPDNYKLGQNFPNPFNPVTYIDFEIPMQCFVKISVFDVLGKEVSILVNEELNGGSYLVDWDASYFSSGIYFYKMEVRDFVQTRKLVLIK